MNRRIVQPLGPDVDAPEDVDPRRERRRMEQRRYYAKHHEEVRKRENARLAKKREATREMLETLKSVASEMERQRPKNDPLLVRIQTAIKNAEGAKRGNRHQRSEEARPVDGSGRAVAGAPRWSWLGSRNG